MVKRVQHPGGVLKQELAELGVSPTSLAHQICVPPNRISQIIAGKRSVTGDTALRFGHWFGVSPEFWMNLQSQYDLALTEQRVGAAVRTLTTVSDRTHLRGSCLHGHQGVYSNDQGWSRESTPVAETSK